MEPDPERAGLTKRYGKVTALNNCDFELYPGEILAVIGDNGAGKSTLIKAISGAVIPDEGEILARRQEVSFKTPIEARAAGIETVYQNLAMSPALSIADNMFMGREIRAPGILGSVFRKLDRPRMEKFAREKLNELGLMTIQNINQAVETLSGGQRQGVAVARAAAFGSKVVILDEPTAALGVKESRRVLELIRDVRSARHADHPDQPQHAACVRGGGPHPHPPAWPQALRDQALGLFDVRRGGLHDRRETARRRDRGGVTPDDDGNQIARPVRRKPSGPPAQACRRRSRHQPRTDLQRRARPETRRLRREYFGRSKSFRVS
jgi:fructose transport system ATP-binding protein